VVKEKGCIFAAALTARFFGRVEGLKLRKNKF